MQHPTTIILTLDSGRVIATADGGTCSTWDGRGFIRRLDRQLAQRGVLRSTGYSTVDGVLVAAATVLDRSGAV